MAKRIAKKAVQTKEGVSAPSLPIYRLIKDLKGNLNGKEIVHSTGDEVYLQPLEAFVFRDWLEKIQC